MKLTVAMGLQYDNGKSTNLYALTIGQGKEKSKLFQEMPITAHTIVPSPISAVVSTGQDALAIFTYDLKGVPVPFISDSAYISLFA